MSAGEEGPQDGRKQGSVFNYDPNSPWSIQTVRIKLQLWDAVGQLDVEVRSNERGMDALETAVEQAVVHLVQAQGDGFPSVVLTRPNGDRIICTDEKLRPEKWFRELVVGLEVMSVRPHDPRSRSVNP